MPRVAILGSGAVGALLAALLQRAGTDVAVITTEASAAAIAADGITVDSPRYGTFTARPPAAPTLTEPADTLVIAVKAPQLPAALDRIQAPVRHVVPLLNGVEHLQALREHFGAATADGPVAGAGDGPDARAGTVVVAGVVRVQAHRAGRTHVVHRAPFLTITLAEPGVTGLEAALAAADVDVDHRATDADVLWGKLARLAGLALATGAADAPLGEVRAEAEAVAREVVAVANAEGASISEQTILGELRGLPDTASSSLRADLAAGAADHELDAIAGAVLRAAARHGIDAPHTARLAAR